MKKVILITGASSGMGKASALKLIEEGHIVYGLARRTEGMAEIVQAGGFAINLDITETEKIQSVVSKIYQQQGRIDVLWNNAGFSVTGAIEDVSEADAKAQFEVNLFGLAEMTKAVLPYMREQGSGLVINTSSVGGKMHTPLGAWYHASKFALEGWSDCLRLEVASFNIDVVVLEPGGVATDFGDVLTTPLRNRSQGGAYELISNQVADMYQQLFTSKKRLASPWVVAKTVSKIVGSKKPKTRYQTGYMAGTVLFFRRILTDRLFDKFILATVKA